MVTDEFPRRLSLIAIVRSTAKLGSFLATPLSDARRANQIVTVTINDRYSDLRLLFGPFLTQGDVAEGDVFNVTWTGSSIL